MGRKSLSSKSTVIEELGSTTTTTTTSKVRKRLNSQSSLGENDNVTSYSPSSIHINQPLTNFSNYLDGKQPTPDSHHGLLDDEDDEELIVDRGTATGPDYVRKRLPIFFAIVCALIFAAVAGYALISFVFPPLWLLNLTALVGYLALDAVVAMTAAVIGYCTFNQLYAAFAYSLNRTKTNAMVLLAIITAAALFAMISVISGGLFPLITSIVLGGALICATLSTFVAGLSLWSIIRFGRSKVDAEADNSLLNITFYPKDMVDFDSEDDNQFQKRLFNSCKYDQFIKLFKDKIYFLQENSEEQEFVQFLQNKVKNLLETSKEVLFRQETHSFNESKYADFIDECLFDMCMKEFTQHQLWFRQTIALFDKQDFAKQYASIYAWDKQPPNTKSYDDDNITQAYDDSNKIDHVPS